VVGQDEVGRLVATEEARSQFARLVEIRLKMFTTRLADLDISPRNERIRHFHDRADHTPSATGIE